MPPDGSRHEVRFDATPVRQKPSEPEAAESAPAPFPYTSMLALSLALLAHGYALTSLFPYVGYMVGHLGATENKDAAGKLLSAYMHV